jgi:hypothetical protein
MCSVVDVLTRANLNCFLRLWATSTSAPVSAKKKDEKSDLRFFFVDLISKIVTLSKFSSRFAKSSRITGPDSLIYGKQRGWLALIDVDEIRGFITSKRREALMRVFGRCRVGLVFVSAFSSRSEFQESLAEPSWETVVWFADEPNHLVYFNGGNLFWPSMT